MKKILFVFLFFLFDFTQATTIQQCLNKATRQVHVLDQTQAIESCFKIYKNQLSIDQCYSLSSQIKIIKKYVEMSETLNSICFYETKSFDNLKNCTNRASQFKIAANHDEALFDCYRQFQIYLNLNQCVELSRYFIYPEKRNHLFQQCQNSL